VWALDAPSQPSMIVPRPTSPSNVPLTTFFSLPTPRRANCCSPPWLFSTFWYTKTLRSCFAHCTAHRRLARDPDQPTHIRSDQGKHPRRAPRQRPRVSDHQCPERRNTSTMKRRSGLVSTKKLATGWNPSAAITIRSATSSRPRPKAHSRTCYIGSELLENAREQGRNLTRKPCTKEIVDRRTECGRLLGFMTTYIGKLRISKESSDNTGSSCQQVRVARTLSLRSSKLLTPALPIRAFFTFCHAHSSGLS